jgi:3-deoxy-7-phosphoheptulonate synthase
MNTAKLNDYKFTTWHPQSWKEFPKIQQPEYENNSLLMESLFFLNSAEKLISEEEILLTQFYLSEATKGKVFILHAGDCAETFESCQYYDVALRVSHLKNLANHLQKTIQKPVIIIGRIAGQYAKPRSEEFEILNDFILPCYRGDIINGIQFNIENRRHDPRRLQIAFKNSKLTLVWIREYFNKFQNSYQKSDFFTSHEALLLNYESSLTHKSLNSNKWFNFGAHYLWLGERTRNIHGAHVEYLRGISNPIGIKVGPKTNPDELLTIIKVLNPEQIPGKINLITRIGDSSIPNNLPNIISKINHSREPIAWSCDPMHGNSIKTLKGLKTRHFNNIWNELKNTYNLHKEMGSHLAGVHLELTYQNVTECLGGNIDITEENLLKNYKSYCDPRLNKEQSFELIDLLARHFILF